MANIAKYIAGASAPPFPTSLLGSGLNSLANNTMSAASSVIDNLTNLDLYADLALHLASLSPGTGAYVSIYILVALDSTPNFPSVTGAVLRNQVAQLWATIQLDTTAATAQDIVVRGLPLPPGKFEVLLDNQSGVSLNASGNTLKMQTYGINLNA